MTETKPTAPNPSAEATSSALTCISGGPLIGAQTGGKFLVWDVPREHRSQRLVAALLADGECGQVVAAWPGMGYTRDYRKATLDQVCAALDREGKAYVRASAPNSK